MADSDISGTAAAIDKGKEKEAPVDDVESSDEEDAEEVISPTFPAFLRYQLLESRKS